jgi:hypothetical protein
MNETTLEQVAIRTGLSTEACLNMLNAGWAYVETIGQPPRWEKTHVH